MVLECLGIRLHRSDYVEAKNRPHYLIHAIHKSWSACHSRCLQGEVAKGCDTEKPASLRLPESGAPGCASSSGWVRFVRAGRAERVWWAARSGGPAICPVNSTPANPPLLAIPRRCCFRWARRLRPCSTAHLRTPAWRIAFHHQCRARPVGSGSVVLRIQVIC